MNYWCLSEQSCPQLQSFPPIALFLVGVDKWSDATPARINAFPSDRLFASQLFSECDCLAAVHSLINGHGTTHPMLSRTLASWRFFLTNPASINAIYGQLDRTMLSMKWIITVTILTALGLPGSSAQKQTLDGVWRSEGYGMVFTGVNSRVLGCRRPGLLDGSLSVTACGY